MTKPIVVHSISTAVEVADMERATAVCAFQLSQHVAPAWGLNPVPVYYTSNPKAAFAGSILVVIADDEAQLKEAQTEEGVLGYHSEDPGGVLLARVFAKPVLDNGGDALHSELSVASVLSHEIAEAFVDPSCNRWCETSDGGLIALEVCDPVEALSYPVSAGGMTATLSDFCLPAWFDGDAAEGALMDYLEKVRSPFSLAKDGYAVVRDTTGKTWEVYGSEYPEWRKGLKTSELARTYRRKGR